VPGRVRVCVNAVYEASRSLPHASPTPAASQRHKPRLMAHVTTCISPPRVASVAKRRPLSLTRFGPGLSPRRLPCLLRPRGALPWTLAPHTSFTRTPNTTSCCWTYPRLSLLPKDALVRCSPPSRCKHPFHSRNSTAQGLRTHKTLPRLHCTPSTRLSFNMHLPTSARTSQAPGARPAS